MMVQRPRRAVYTALLGSYEKPALRLPPVDEHIPHLFFTDSEELEAPVGWHAIRVAPRFPWDQVRSARFLKIHGHEFLADFDEVMWLDNRVLLKQSVVPLFEGLGEADVLFPYHSFRSTVRAEFVEVIASGYDDPTRVRQMYRIAAGLNVLAERPLWTGLYVRSNSGQAFEFSSRWFELLLATTRRDQLSVNAALALSGIDRKLIELENAGSAFHHWSAGDAIGRDRKVQRWRLEERSAGLRASDALRATEPGRLAARLLEKLGLSLPALPRIPSRTPDDRR